MLGSGYVESLPPESAAAGLGFPPPPSLQLNFADLGNGAASIVPSIGTESPGTFTNAAQGWTKLSSGLWAAGTNGVLRGIYSGFTTAAGSYLGGLFEGARTNSCLQARDLSNASWTKTSATGAKDQAGIDGSANSASSLVATAGNGTATQALTIASAAKTVSFWIKRITGTGTVQITLDNFATNTDVTALINASTYTQVTMTQTLANPTVGIKIVTSGDKIAVDMAGLEDSASFASTPIPTTVAAVTRNTDLLTFPFSPWVNVNAGTMVVTLNRPGTYPAASDFRPWGSDAGKFPHPRILNGSSVTVVVPGVTANAVSQSQVFNAGTTYKMGIGYTQNGTAVLSVAGQVPSTSGASADYAISGNLVVGDSGSSTPLHGAISSLRYYPTRLPDGVIQQLTT